MSDTCEIRIIEQFEDYAAQVEVWSSGRALERVTKGGVELHQCWFDARNLGPRRGSRRVVGEYACCLLHSIKYDHERTPGVAESA